MILPYANSECMNQHLQEISKNVAEGHHAVVIVDRAGWHISGRLNIPRNISLMPLPPYAPELNPQENIWQWIKNRHLNNRVFDSLSDITKAATNAWNDFVKQPGIIKSIAFRKWACL